MVQNPEGTIAFINRLRDNLRRHRKTFVYLRDVTRIEYDAIVVLLSIMMRFKGASVGFLGDFPADPRADAILKRSGFFEYLYREIPEQDVYNFQETHSIRTHGDRNVNPELGAEVIQQAATAVWGTPRRVQGAQRVLLELMQNTNNHASLDAQGEKHWWLSVNRQAKTKQAQFVFVDLGVGVFRSLDSKPDGNKFHGWREKLRSLVTGETNADLLRLILAGELHRTVTGHAFRGKGLPGIEEAFQRNWLSNLVIITNDVYAHVARNEFRTLKNPFSGTMVSWELNASNHSVV